MAAVEKGLLGLSNMSRFLENVRNHYIYVPFRDDQEVVRVDGGCATFVTLAPESRMSILSALW